MNKKQDNITRVIVVDDSALIRKVLSEILNSDPAIEVVATAGDPMDAREKIRELNPDVITLDIVMPKLDGLSFLRKIMQLRPMPVLVISSLTENGSMLALEALEIGAIDVFAKSKLDLEKGLLKTGEKLINSVKQAKRASLLTPVRNLNVIGKTISGRLSNPNLDQVSKNGIIGIGASTGGVYVLSDILSKLPANLPPILVVQHMTGAMIESFSMRLNSISSLNVKIAENGERLKQGHVYVASKEGHLTVARMGGHFVANIRDDVDVYGHKPSVDKLFNSIAKTARGAGIGVILSGMGADGAKGLLAMHQAGAITACQDKATSMIYGMPGAAKRLGAASIELGLDAIPEFIVSASAPGRNTKRNDL